MFIYSFKSTNTIIRHIVISGQHLVLYTSQEQCIAIQPLINQLNLNGRKKQGDRPIQGNHPNHHLLHNPFVLFSRNDAVPHKHLKLSNSDRFKNLKDIFKFLIKRQHSPKLRKEEQDQLLRGLHKERESYGHKEFPKDIQKSIQQYDLTSPFFPEEELEDLLSAFEKYNRSNSFSFYAEQISIHIEKILDENWKIIYSKIISFSDDDSTDDNFQVFKYYEYLGDLRLALLGIHHENSLKWCNKAISMIDNINENPYYKQFIVTEPSVSETLKSINQKINVKKASELNRISILIAAGLMAADYFRVDSTSDYIRHIVAISIVSITINYGMKLSNNLYQFFPRPKVLPNKKTGSDTLEIDFGFKPDLKRKKADMSEKQYAAILKELNTEELSPTSTLS